MSPNSCYNERDGLERTRHWKSKTRVQLFVLKPKTGLLERYSRAARVSFYTS